MAAATVNAAEWFPDLKLFIDPAFRQLTEHDSPVCTVPLSFAQKFTIPVTSTDDADDITRLIKCPPGAYIWRWRSSPSDMDTGTALVYSIVATDDSDVIKVTLVSGSTKGQAGTASDVLADAAVGAYVGGYWISMKTTTAATTPVAGTLACAWQMSQGVINRASRKVRLDNWEA